jgi:hypothetical protein
MDDAIKNNKSKMAKLQKNPNPSMVDIDEMIAKFGNYEQPASNNSND